MASNGDNDIWGLLKSGLSLFAHVVSAIELEREGRNPGAHGLQAGRDLVDVGQRLARLASNAMQTQSTTMAVRTGPLNLTGKWKQVKGTVPTKYFIEITHNPSNGAILINYPRAEGIDGFNEYFGAANSSNIFVSGNNTHGNYTVFSARAAGSTITGTAWVRGADVPFEFIWMRA